jgi:hypothetical protein
VADSAVDWVVRPVEERKPEEMAVIPVTSEPAEAV